MFAEWKLVVKNMSCFTCLFERFLKFSWDLLQFMEWNLCCFFLHKNCIFLHNIWNKIKIVNEILRKYAAIQAQHV